MSVRVSWTRRGDSKKIRVRSSRARERRTRPALPGAAGREALEAEAVGGQAGQRQGRQDRGGAGRDRHGHARLVGGDDEAVARVGDRGHAGVGDHEDAGAAPGRRDEMGGPVAFIVLVEGHEAGDDADARALGEGAQAAGVLGGDDVGGGQGTAQTVCDVSHIANRRGGQRNSAGAQGKRVGGRADAVVGLRAGRGVTHGLSMVTDLDSPP